jgi:hypothetical protein
LRRLQMLLSVPLMFEEPIKEFSFLIILE